MSAMKKMMLCGIQQTWRAKALIASSTIGLRQAPNLLNAQTLPVPRLRPTFMRGMRLFGKKVYKNTMTEAEEEVQNLGRKSLFKNFAHEMDSRMPPMSPTSIGTC